MKKNSEIRREAFARLRQGRWFFRLLSVTLLFGALQQAAGGALDFAFGRFGLQTWFDFLQAKAVAMQGGLDYAVPSRAIAAQMHQATAFWAFIMLIFAGMTYLAVSTSNLKAAEDDASSWGQTAFGALARPLGCAALAFVLALRITLWSLLLVVPGIVAGYRYSQVWNVRAEHPDWQISQCFAESARLMEGRKMQRLRLDLSFMLPVIACVTVQLVAFQLQSGAVVAAASVVSVAAMVYVSLWMALARAVFYRAAKEDCR